MNLVGQKLAQSNNFVYYFTKQSLRERKNVASAYMAERPCVRTQCVCIYKIGVS